MPLRLQPLTPHLGVEIHNLDLTADIGADDARTLRDALDRRFVLLVRGQAIDNEDQLRFARIFGEIDTRISRQLERLGRPAPKDSQYVSNTRDDGVLRGGEIAFHNDELFFEEPNTATVLHALEVTSTGGETLFQNTALTYASLVADERAALDRLSALHVFAYGDGGSAGALQGFGETIPDDIPHWRHPLIYTHPRTGQRTLWVTASNTLRVPELDPGESSRLIQRLCGLIAASTEVYRHAWKVGDTLIWNNVMIQHARTDFPPSERRTLRRTPVQ